MSIRGSTAPCRLKITSSQNYNHAGTGANEEQRGGAGIAEGDESGFQSRKDKTACSCRLSPRSPRPRDVISTKKSVQNYKTGFLRRSTAVSSQGARAGKRGRVRLAGTASPHLCPADARHDLKTGFCLRSPPRRLTDHFFSGFARGARVCYSHAFDFNPRQLHEHRH